jgi:hypothetical protein
MTNRSHIAIALAAIAGGIATANADVVLALTYHNLDGMYTEATPGNGQFTAIAVDQGPAGLQSAGQVSRLDYAAGDAQFETGFVSHGSLASFRLDISVSVLFPNQLAIGSGSLRSVDRNGDSITADIDGSWIYDTVEGFIYFNGALSNVVVNNPSGDNSFDGSAFGGWTIAGNNATEGALTQIVFGAGSFFNGNFNNAATGVTAQIIPAPASLALIGLGGLAAGRRRR